MIRFCTYFDTNYLIRGVTLCRSIRRFMPTAEIWVLCLDDATAEALAALDLSGVRSVRRATLESFDAELAATASTRRVVEYYFTCTPSWCAYVLAHSAPGDLVCYVDADVLFYSSPELALAELEAGSILIMPHRFAPGSSAAERSGTFNVGLIAFRNDETSTRCVARWRAQCLKSCHDRPADGKFADQKYLDEWPQRYMGVVVSRRLGSCLAPWNFHQYRIDTTVEPITVNEEPLVFFHFHGLTIFSPWLYESGTPEYGAADAMAERALYSRYFRELHDSARLLNEHGVPVKLRDWVWRRRRRSLPALLRKLIRARVDRPLRL